MNTKKLYHHQAHAGSSAVNSKDRTPALTVRHGDVPGTAVLRVNSVVKQRGAHEWQWASDGFTWHCIATTVRATMVIALPQEGKVYFRSRVITRNGPGTWSRVESIIVL